MFALSDDEIRQATGQRYTGENCRIKVVFQTTTKKKKEDAPSPAIAKILIAPKDDLEPEIIERNLHYGLFILGTEKHESRRIDNQLRGRA